MKNVRFCVSAFALLLSLISSLQAQAVHTADRESRVQAGLGILYLSPDYTLRNIKGVSFWADYRLPCSGGDWRLLSTSEALSPRVTLRRTRT